MPILGVPTIIAVLYNLYDDQGSESVSDNLRRVFGAVGAYLQVILAGTQGVAIFFFYCFYNDEVRDAHKLATQRRKSMSSLVRIVYVRLCECCCSSWLILQLKNRIDS